MQPSAEKGGGPWPSSAPAVHRFRFAIRRRMRSVSPVIVWAGSRREVDEADWQLTLQLPCARYHVRYDVRIGPTIFWYDEEEVEVGGPVDAAPAENVSVGRSAHKPFRSGFAASTDTRAPSGTRDQAVSKRDAETQR